MSWQCLRCGGVDGHHGWCPEGPLIPCVPGPTEKELAYIAKDELDRLRAVAEAAKRYRNATKPGAWPRDRMEELRAAERELDEALAATKQGGEE